jgi:hypothetical protein
MTEPPFAELPLCAREHFRLHALACATHLIDAAGRALGSHEALLEQFPFLVGYLDEVNALGALPPADATFDWQSAIEKWHARSAVHLPILALRDSAELDFTALMLLMCVGLIEEDGRFGSLFEAFNGVPGQQRPTSGLLNAWWRQSADTGGVQVRVRKLRELGLVDALNADLPRNHGSLQVPALVWDALRGDFPAVPNAFMRHCAVEVAAATEEPLFESGLSATLAELPALLVSGQIDAVIVRGPHHNGRRTLLRWLARELGRGLLEVELTGKPDTDRERLRAAATLSTLLHAMPVLLADLAPGETLELPKFAGGGAPLGIVLGKSGGIRGDALDRSITLHVELPSTELRARHLSGALNQSPPAAVIAELAASFRMTSGNLLRGAHLAEAHAALASRNQVCAEDLRCAARALGRPALDTLATRLEDAGDWRHFAAANDTLRELRILEQRCRHREHLGPGVGDALSHGLNAGVRALFQGPSGTGKTLAARLLASSLEKDLYRVDLSATVNKYIGESEKNLERIFASAEELDCVLLFDEGDALFSRRTGVSSANDRYANLETNFLLQRIESFEGIVIVTTNAGELIDGAFQRRMDVVVDFRSPEPAERWSLWQMHLPERHVVDPALLRETAARCALTGGQIRNAALHASLLALGDGTTMHSEHLEAAVRREYRKSGGVCPLRVLTAVAGRG